MPAPRSRLTVDLNALATNYRHLATLAGGAEVAPVVKADAYGLGADAVSRRLWAEGARSFHVARLEEGEALRSALGPDAAIYVLDGCPAGAAPRLRAADLIPILNNPGQLEAYGAAARAGGQRLPCGLHVDTGMNRLGFRLEEIEALLQASDRLQAVSVQLLMSHLACADEPEHRMNARQVGRFRQAQRLFPQARASLANSAGIFLGEEFLFDMVRPGISLYGGGPESRPHRDISPVATFEAPVLDVHAVTAGESVGYGAAFEADSGLRVAILAAGYADGVLRSSAGLGRVWLGGQARRLLGRVSMDLMAVDVTGLEGVYPGVMAQIIGPDLTLDEAAAAAASASYELLVRLGARAERVYLGGV